MLDEQITELIAKRAFVRDVGDAIGKHTTCCIKSLDYDVFSSGSIIYEYLVVTYKGDAIAVRNCCGNSLSAIMDEIAALFNGGYYDELDYYNTVKRTAQNILD